MSARHRRLLVLGCSRLRALGNVMDDANLCHPGAATSS